MIDAKNFKRGCCYVGIENANIYKFVDLCYKMIM